MKLIILSALVAVAVGGFVGPHVGHGVGALGASAGGGLGGVVGGGLYGGGGYVDHYAKPNYNYAYAVKDAYSGVHSSAVENRLGHKTEGAYSTALPDGRKQVVKYFVDGNSGYNADVQYYGVAKHPKTPIYSYGAGGYRGIGGGIGGIGGGIGSGIGGIGGVGHGIGGIGGGIGGISGVGHGIGSFGGGIGGIGGGIGGTGGVSYGIGGGSYGVHHSSHHVQGGFGKGGYGSIH